MTKTLSSPREARACHELRRYHTRPLRLNWGPENVHIGKTQFRDPNINARIFIFFGKFNKQTKTLIYLHTNKDADACHDAH